MRPSARLTWTVRPNGLANDLKAPDITARSGSSMTTGAEVGSA